MLKLEIVTPEKKVFDDTVDSVTVPTASGEAGILPNHAPLVSALAPGLLSYSNKGISERLAISGGFVEVNANKVSVLADVARTAAEIDADAARAECEAAERELASSTASTVEQTEAIRERIETAAAQLHLAAGK